MRAPTMERTRPRLQQRTVAICAFVAVLFFLPPAQAAADVTKAAEAMGAPELALPPLGGSGGGYFTARCPGDQHLTGVRLRVGDDVDAIQPLCRTYTESPYLERELVPGGYQEYKTVERWNIELGPIQHVGDLIGGPGGGGIVDVLCDDDIVTGMLVGAEGVDTITVNRIALFCELESKWFLDYRDGKYQSCKYDSEYRSTQLSAGRPQELFPDAEFEGPIAKDREGFFSDDYASHNESNQHCPCGQVAVGITGRAGKWLDAVGLICGELQVKKAVRAQGRVKLPPGTASLPPLPICEAARQARARNSPAAPGLEAQCAAQPAVKAQGRVKLDQTNTPPRPALSICEAAQKALARNSPAARGLAVQCEAEKNRPPPVDLAAHQARAAEIDPGESVVTPGPEPIVKAQARVKLAPSSSASSSHWTRPICDIAKQARDRNSPAAPGLEAQCAAFVKLPLAEHDDLVAKGEAIAREDPLAVELLDQQPDNSARIGFDVGMAVAEKQTAYGPGKQHIHDSLPAEEQSGFRAAVDFSLERNSHDKLAAAGAAIARADPVVAKARNASLDVFYRLGFDIASAFFGDPALGGLGNTGTGPGSLGVRDTLSAAGQDGFNAAAAFHFGRNYKP